MSRTFKTILDESVSAIFSFLSDSTAELDNQKTDEPEDEMNKDQSDKCINQNTDNSIFYDFEPSQSAETYLFDDSISFSQDMIINNEENTKQEMIVKTINGEPWDNKETITVQKVYIHRLKHRISELEDKLEVRPSQINNSKDSDSILTQQTMKPHKYDQIAFEKEKYMASDKNEISNQNIDENTGKGINEEQDVTQNSGCVFRRDIENILSKNHIDDRNITRKNIPDAYGNIANNSNTNYIDSGNIDGPDGRQDDVLDAYGNIDQPESDETNSTLDHSTDKDAEATIITDSSASDIQNMYAKNVMVSHFNYMNLNGFKNIAHVENIKENIEEMPKDIKFLGKSTSSPAMYNESFYSPHEDRIGNGQPFSLVERRPVHDSFSETNRLLCALKEKDALINDLNSRIENMHIERARLEMALEILEKDLIRLNENKEMYIHLATQEIESLKNTMESLRDLLEFERSKNHKIRSNLFDTRKKCIEMVEAVEILTSNYEC